MPVLEASLDGAGLRVCVVVARWNEFVTRKLLEGAESSLGERGVAREDITVAWVPGAFEVRRRHAGRRVRATSDAVICLGVSSAGRLPTSSSCRGRGGRDRRGFAGDGVPVIFGVLTVENVEQALSRCGGKDGHKGEEAAQAAIEMANLRKLLA